jgi:hydroxymethylglutaryl-CoA synthase
MTKFNLKTSDLDYFVPHQPNPAFPIKVARDIGFKDEQYACALQVNKFGNTYSGCSAVGLAAVLDIAEPEQRILIASYGSGAGSDAYLLRTTSQLLDKRRRQKVNVKILAENKFVKHVDYTTYRRLKQGM